VDIDKIQKQIVSRKEAREKLGLQQEEFIVLGVGRLNPIKRFDLLIKAFAIMLKKQPNAELLIAGNGKEQKKLVKLVDKMDIADKVIFWGNIDTVTEIYCAADVVAITSKSESSSLVAIEAQACGTRCVMSDGVPSESIISSCSRRMDANATLIDWADALLDNDYRGKPICSALDYEVHVTSDNMKKIYLKYYKEYEREK
jgi:glycosyltransferase involved in cell wall biosynthesis